MTPISPDPSFPLITPLVAQAVDSSDWHDQSRGFRQTWVPSWVVIASRDAKDGL